MNEIFDKYFPLPQNFHQEWIEIPLKETIIVQAGHQYTFRLKASDNSNNLWLDMTNPYINGHHSYNIPSSPDLAFKIYIHQMIEKKN